MRAHVPRQPLWGGAYEWCGGAMSDRMTSGDRERPPPRQPPATISILLRRIKLGIMAQDQ